MYVQLIRFWHWMPLRVKGAILFLCAIQLFWVWWALVRYVYAPWKLYRTSVISTDDKTRAVEENSDVIDDGVGAVVASGEAALATLGFDGAFRTTTSVASPLTAVASALEHEVNGDLGSVISIRSTTSSTQALVNCVTFESKFADGAKLITSNAGTKRYWPYEPASQVVRFVGLHDIPELYRLHRLRVAAQARRSAQSMLSRGSTPDRRLVYAKREAMDFYNHLVRCGYRRRAPDGLRPTIRGALFSAWRHTFPWRHWNEWNELRRARSVRSLA
jgi:hypothetical protein